MKVDLHEVINTYKTNHLNYSELEYVEFVSRLRDWDLKTDEEKHHIHKGYLKMKEVHFSEEETLEYEKCVIECSKKILLFLEQYNVKITDYEILSSQEKIIYRLYNLLYCEKEIIFRPFFILGIRVHVPLYLIEYLMSELNDNIKNKFALNDLLTIYKEMINKFPE